ncbi:kinase-like domain-containing protein [Thamnidium elegans]|nr:kinase-like domain-containing protein [Thamnidium elegans]
MFLSRLNSNKALNEEDPLLLFEQTIAQYTEMNDYTYNLLKTVIIKYKDDIRYKNSPLYLRLWLTYILYLNVPQFILPILCSLIDNNIGDKLATLYEAIAYFQFISKKKQEAETTLLLGLKNKAQPIKRLERVLNQFYFKKVIDFDTEYYRIIQYHNEYYKPLKTDHTMTLKSQLDWIDAELQHSIRTGVLRECNHKNKCFEELRTMSNNYYYTFDGRFNDIKKEIGIKLKYTSFFLKNKKGDSFYKIGEFYDSTKIITPSIDQTEPIYQQQHIQQQQHTTKPEFNVTQLPHSAGFIQNQLVNHGIDKRPDYHIYNINSTLLLKDSIQLQDTTYHVVNKIGQGGMAQVYLVQNINTLSYFSIKVQQPPHPWEFYILTQIHERRKNHSPRVLPLFGFYQYLDKSYLLMAYVQTGTLLDVLNLYRTKQHSSCIPEPIVLLFILQLLKQIEALHHIHITHNDLKLDNIMLGMRKNPKSFPALIMIDYGYSIDLLALKESTCKATWSPACPQSDYPLLNSTYHPIQADYWQLATMAHLLLFGVQMRYTTKQNTGYRIQQTIKRYWHKQLWLNFFEFMLNPQSNDLSGLIREFKTESNTIQSKVVQDFITFLFP